MQQTLSGCAFCDAPPCSEMGEAHTWGKDERVTHSICVDCAVQERPNPEEHDHHTCDGCGLVFDALAALTRFRVARAIGRPSNPQYQRFRRAIQHAGVVCKLRGA